MHCHEYPARFRDFTVGELFEHTRFFDLLNDGIETLMGEIGHELRDVVASNGIPYAPVDCRGVVICYPSYQETRAIQIHATPVEVADRSFVVDYEFRRDDVDEPFCRIQQTHVTIGEGGAATSVPDGLRSQLEQMIVNRTALDTGRVPAPPGPPISDAADFSRQVQFRSPHIEAAQLGFMGEYFRFIATAFESHLESRGISMADASRSAPYPFLPRTFRFEFHSPIRFEDHVIVRGAVMDLEPAHATVRYDLIDADDGTRKIAGTTRYGCIGAGGSPTRYPQEYRSALASL